MPDSRCACTALSRATRAVTAAREAALAPSGLRVTLARLGPLPVTRLAKEAAPDRSIVGRNLDPPERRGLVAMTIGATDARERVVRRSRWRC